MTADPIEFLSWMLNSLHLTLNGTKKANSSIIYKTFQGQMRIYTKKILPVDIVRFELNSQVLLCLVSNEFLYVSG